MSREILEAMHALAREKGIEPEKLMIALEDALLSAYKKQPGSAKYARVEMDRETADFRVIELIIPERLEAHLIVETIDEETTVDPETGEMREPEEPEIDPKKFAEYRDQIDERDVTPDDFGRIAAQTAKQVILQRIREAERDMMYEEYRDRVGELITGIVQQSDSRYTLVQLRERVEALLPKSEQVEGERYDHSQRIKAVIKEVSPSTKGPAIIVSRRDPELIKKLFELEVPEIADGLVEIANVAREPGYRSKIAVISHTDGVDPVGACVGPRGSRVRMVVSELRGEKIDIIPFNDEPARFVAKALSPARVREVLVDDEAKQATVIVPDDQLSLAIGREGQNARLAARLTGWRVDIRSETEFAAEEAEHGYEEEEVQGRCAAILSNGTSLPQRLAAELALLRPRHPPGARQHRQRQRRRPCLRRRGGRAARRHRGAGARGSRRGAGDIAGHVPRRRCVGCGRIAPKSELLRIAVADRRAPDRGASARGSRSSTATARCPAAAPTCVAADPGSAAAGRSRLSGARHPPRRDRPRAARVGDARPQARRIGELMSKKRVHEIAKEHGLSSKELLEKLKAAGVEAKAAASSVEEDAALKVLGARRQRQRRASRCVAGARRVDTSRAGSRQAHPTADARARCERAIRHGPAEAPRRRRRQPPRRPPSGPVHTRSRRANTSSDRHAGPGPAAPGAAAPAGSAAAAAAERVRPTRDSRTGERTPGDIGPGGRRRVVIDSQASRRQQGGPSNQPQRRPRRGRRRRGTYDETIAPIDTAAMEATDLIRVNSGSTVKDIAEYLGVAVPEVIKKLMSLGEMATLTQTLSDDAIQVLADEFDKQIEIVHAADDVEVEPVFEDAEEDLIERPPVVTIMGHVDHGKTSLLDAIRETEVVAGEAGGITQHIGAYQVRHAGKEITFLDTPGHEAFTAMRARGANVTDLAVIVVAADDGVKPQTEEAIDHAKAAEVPIIVAVNKIDKEGAQPERVRTEMTQHGLQPSEWGGDIEFVDVSAKTHEGLDTLLETIQVVTDLEELKANAGAEASGAVIESKLDPGRGPVVTILIQRGTLRVGDALVAGAHFGRVRAMHDFTGGKLKRAMPGQPVEVLGFDGVPEAGEHVRVVENERRARQLAGERANRLKTEALARRSGRKVSLEDVFKLAQEGTVKELGLVVKADVAGSLEAIEDEIAKLPQQEVKVNIIHRGVGGINESDVMLASASDGVILAFNVRPVGDARQIADREGVEIRSYAVIYRAIEELRAAMQGMLEPAEVETPLGQAEVRQLFKASRIGTIAGSFVTEGKVTRGSRVRVVREGTVIYDTTIESLRRFNEDVREVASGFECGIVLTNFQDLREGDVLETYETRQVERELST